MKYTNDERTKEPLFLNPNGGGEIGQTTKSDVGGGSAPDEKKKRCSK